MGEPGGDYLIVETSLYVRITQVDDEKCLIEYTQGELGFMPCPIDRANVAMSIRNAGEAFSLALTANLPLWVMKYVLNFFDAVAIYRGDGEFIVEESESLKYPMHRKVFIPALSGSSGSARVGPARRRLGHTSKATHADRFVTS